jgi:glycosyltransferase involved in cell wall biosynthesis
MKILYIAQVSNSETSSVSRKIYSQCNALIRLGNICEFISIFGNKVKLYKFVDGENFFEKTILQESFIDKIRRWLNLFFSNIPEEAVHVATEFNPDIIYIRNISPLFPSYISFLRKIKGNAKVFWEFPTYPYFQEYFQPFKITSLIHMFFDLRSIERLRKVVDEFVVVNEIDDKAAKERLYKYRVIPNGFDVTSVPVKKSPKLEDEIHILGLANLANWHGYDRIIAGISEYKGPKAIIFHLAGGAGKAEIEKLKKQAVQLGISSNIIFYPPLYGKELSELFNKCHIAAGSLGLHRIKLQKGSILKLREYCSMGIPFFSSYMDDDFKIFEFCMTLEASEEPIDMSKICSFIETVYKTENYSLIMRKYAEENLDWKIKMSKLFD